MHGRGGLVRDRGRDVLAAGLPEVEQHQLAAGPAFAVFEVALIAVSLVKKSQAPAARLTT